MAAGGPEMFRALLPEMRACMRACRHLYGHAYIHVSYICVCSRGCRPKVDGVAADLVYAVLLRDEVER